MADQNTLLIRKVGKPETKKDLLSNMGIVVLELPVLIPSEVKDSGSRDWPDEHGLDVYNASEAYFKDFDVDIRFGVKSANPEGCHSAYSALLTYLTTNGILHDIYCPWTNIGRTKVRYRGTSDINFERESNESFMTFKVRFNITDPITIVNEF